MNLSIAELGKIIGQGLKKSEDQDQSLSHPSGEDTNIVFPFETVNLRMVNLVISTRDTTADSLWGLGNWGTMLWDGTYTESFVEIVRRRWEWRDQDELEAGIWSATISVANGEIKLV